MWRNKEREPRPRISAQVPALWLMMEVNYGTTICAVAMYGRKKDSGILYSFLSFHCNLNNMLNGKAYKDLSLP